MDFSNSTRGADGLYTVTVRDLTNRQDVVMPSKYIRFQSRQELTIGTKPDRALVNRTYNEKKDIKKFLQLFAQTLQSENDFMTATFGAVYEKKNGNKVVAVYVPVENIKSDTDAKFVLANLHAMAMSEGEIVKRADKAYKGKPFELRMDAEELQVIIDTSYDPGFVVDFEMPDDESKKDVVVDSRIIVERNMSESKKSIRPAFLNKGFKGANNQSNDHGGSAGKSFGILVSIVLVVLVLYFLKKSFSK